MKIIARVLKTGPIAKPSEKDQKKGLRFITIVREEISKTIGDQTHGEFLIYSIKTTDEPEIIEEDKYLIEGNLWEVRDNNQIGIRIGYGVGSNISAAFNDCITNNKFGNSGAPLP